MLPSLPPGFPLGSQGVYSTVVPASSLTSSASLLACSPGAASTAPSAPLLQPFGAGQLQEPGGCYAYSDPNVGWQPAGSSMNTYRGGGTITKMGNYIVAMGMYSILKLPTDLNFLVLYCVLPTLSTN